VIPPGIITSAPIVGSGGAFSSSNRNLKVVVERLGIVGIVNPGVPEWLLRGVNDIFGLTSTAQRGFGAWPDDDPMRSRSLDKGQTNNKQQPLGLIPKTTCSCSCLSSSEYTRAVYGETIDNII
jgi:hypothetical protein